jgi:hypothetical protein
VAQSTDLVVPNTSAAGVRSAINTRLLAIATHQSGATAPATTYAYQFWADTTAGLLKQRDGANTSWITIGTLGTANLGLATLASPTFTGTPAGPTATAGTNTTQLATTAFVTTAVANASPVLETAQNSTSGTSIDFTSIPSWVKRITVMFNGVGTSGGNGTSGNNFRIILGTSSSLESTGYSLIASLLSTAGELITSTAGFVFQNYSNSTRVNGSLTLNNVSGNTWVATGLFGSIYIFNIAGSKALASTLTRLQITTVNGTDTFNAGSINILYE